MAPYLGESTNRLIRKFAVEEVPSSFSKNLLSLNRVSATYQGNKNIQST